MGDMHTTYIKGYHLSTRDIIISEKKKKKKMSGKKQYSSHYFHKVQNYLVANSPKQLEFLIETVSHWLSF